MLGLGQFGLLPQDCLGEFFEAAEQDLQLSILEGGGSIQGRRFRRELHIDLPTQCLAHEIVVAIPMVMTSNHATTFTSKTASGR